MAAFVTSSPIGSKQLIRLNSTHYTVPELMMLYLASRQTAWSDVLNWLGMDGIINADRLLDIVGVAVTPTDWQISNNELLLLI